MREGSISKNTEVSGYNKLHTGGKSWWRWGQISARFSKDKTRMTGDMPARTPGWGSETGTPASIIQESGFKVRTKARARQPHPGNVASNIRNHEQPSKTSWDWKIGRDRTRGLGPYNGQRMGAAWTSQLWVPRPWCSSLWTPTGF